MNLTKNIDLKLFYEKTDDKKIYFEVMWWKYKEEWQGLKFIGFENKKEARKSGPFSTRSGADGFVRTLFKNMKGFTGEYEILEYK